MSVRVAFQTQYFYHCSMMNHVLYIVQGQMSCSPTAPMKCCARIFQYVYEWVVSHVLYTMQGTDELISHSPHEMPHFSARIAALSAFTRAHPNTILLDPIERVEKVSLIALWQARLLPDCLPAYHRADCDICMRESMPAYPDYSFE